MSRLAVTAVFLMILASGCGPDNPFDPDPPSPSALTAVLTGGTTAKLSWTMCPDSDFASYTLYRSGSPGIQNNPGSASVLVVIDKNTTTTYYDEGVSGKLYYVIKTTNEAGDYSWSNEASIQTKAVGKIDK